MSVDVATLLQHIQENCDALALEHSGAATAPPPRPPAAAAAAAAMSDDHPAAPSEEDSASPTDTPAAAPSRLRRSLTRHTATLPAAISVGEFGAYLKFVNRADQCDALVQRLQSSFLSSFVPQASIDPGKRVSADQYLKPMPIVFSAGAPGIGQQRTCLSGESACLEH